MNVVLLNILIAFAFLSCKSASYQAITGKESIDTSDIEAAIPGNIDSNPLGQDMIQTREFGADDEGGICPTGGILIETGNDANGDQVLSPDEVAQAEKVCNGETITNTEIVEKEILKMREVYRGKDVNGTLEIVMGMDTSGSMKQEKAQLEANMKLFIDNLEKEKVNARVTAIGNDKFNFPQDLPSDKFRVVNTKIGSHDAISKLTSFFAGNHGLEPESGLEIFIFTDDNGMGIGNTADDFKGPVGMKFIKVSGIVGLKKGQDPNNANCNIANVGEEYKKLAAATKGIIVDICMEDWSKLLEQLSENVILSNLSYPLAEIPNFEKEVIVKINDQAIEKSADDKPGYSIDTEKKLLIFSRELAIGDDDIVEIIYFPVVAN